MCLIPVFFQSAVYLFHIRSDHRNWNTEFYFQLALSYSVLMIFKHLTFNFNLLRLVLQYLNGVPIIGVISFFMQFHFIGEILFCSVALILKCPYFTHARYKTESFTVVKSVQDLNDAWNLYFIVKIWGQPSIKFIKFFKNRGR